MVRPIETTHNSTLYLQDEAMIEANTYKEIANTVNRELQSQSQCGFAFDSLYPVSHNSSAEINSRIKKHSLIAVMFCNPSTEFFKKEISGSLEYFHNRSREHINIFCCGFGAHWPKGKYSDQTIASTINSVEWSFSSQALISVIEEFEKKTKWKYSGESELLILDVSPSEDPDNIKINSAIVCNLETMKKDNAFSSVRAFFEDLIRYVSSDKCEDAWIYSDINGGKIALSFLKESALSLLPAALKDAYRKAESYAVRQI